MKLSCKYFYKRSLGFPTRFEKILHDVNDCLRTFSEQTRNCFSADSGKHFDWCTPNTMIGLRLLLSAGQNISSKMPLWFVFNEDSNISAIFHSQTRVKNTLDKENCYTK